MNNPNTEELLDLIHTLRKGDLNELQTQRLEELVGNDPDCLWMFAEYRLLEASLDLELTPAKPDLPLELEVESPLRVIVRSQGEFAAKTSWSRRNRWFWSGAALFTAACAAALLIAFQLRPPQPSTSLDLPKIVELEGNAYLINRKSQAKPLKIGKDIPSGQTIRTGDVDSSVVIQFADSTKLQLNSNSIVRINHSKSGRKRLFLSRGVMVVDVAPQKEKQPMIITTPHATVRVLGTRLISAASDMGTRVELEEGEVEFTRRADGRSVRIKQGSFAEATSRIEPLLAQPLPRVLTESDLSIPTRVSFLEFSPANKQIVIADRGLISFWSLDGKSQGKIPNPVGPLREMRLSGNGSLLAIGGQERHAAVVEADSGRLVQKFPSDRMGVRTIAISPDGKFIAYSNMEVRKDETIVWLYKVGDQKKYRKLTANAQEVVTLDFSPKGKLLAGGTRNGKVFVWDLESGEPESVWLGNRRIRKVRFSPDGSLLASSDHRGTVRVWSTKTWKEQMVLQDPDRDLPAIAISPDNSWIAVGTHDGRIRIWNLTTGEEGLILRAHDRRQVCHVVFAGNTNIVASCGWTLPLKIWDVSKYLP